MKIHPKLFAALESRGLSEPTLAQSSTWPEIDAGGNILLIAPTGVGKTEAAMVPLFHRLLEQKSKPISILYITPLRSLDECPTMPRDVYRIFALGCMVDQVVDCLRGW